MKKLSDSLLMVVIADIWLVIGVILLIGCIPKPTSIPTDVPTPKPIEYLIMRDCVTCSAPVWPKVNAQTNVLGYIKVGDTVPIRTRQMEGDQLWLEVLVGELHQFEIGTVGWVKFRPEKMLTEWRQP